MSDNIFNDVLTGVSTALLPLKEIDSVERSVALFKKIGYTLPDIPSLPTDLIGKVGQVGDGVLDLAEASSDEARLQAVLALVPKIKDVAEGISGLINALQNTGAVTADFINHAPVSEMPRRLLDYVIASYIDTYYSGPYSFMLLLGMFDEVDLPADAAIFQPAVTLRKVCWERIPKYFSQPRQLATDIYNWENDFNSDLFLLRLERVLRGYLLPGGIYNQNPSTRTGLGNTNAGTKEIRMPIFQAGDSPELFSQFGLLISGAEPANGEKKGLALMPYFVGGSDMVFNLNPTFEIVFKASASIDNGVGLILRPPFKLEVVDNLFTAPASVGNFDIKVTARKKLKADAETIIFGSPGSSRLSIKGFEFAAYAAKKQADVDFGIELSITEARIVITMGDADGFLQKLLSGVELDVKFDIGLGYSAKGGVYFKGSGGLEITIPAHITLGPVEIQSALIGIRFNDGKIPIDFAASIKGSLGPVVVVIQNIGLTTELSFPADGKGNVGPINLAPAFKPPTGIGISIDAGIVKGGGYILFDDANKQYAGALELSIADTLQIAAICVITTRMPDGSDGFSLLIIISVTFSPGISLSMGFFLSGIGGMLGINRTINVDALREGVKNNAIDHIMFPEDIINNITTIIQQITTIFPPKKDQFIIGLMLRITWGVPALVTIDFGLMVEFASPVRLAILGVLKIALPTEEAAVLQLQVNFVGIIDFDKGMLTFDASLYNSRILTFTLEGDMALRLGWGETKGFLLSVGGFHPSFKPPVELKVPSMKRLTLTILADNPRLILTCYFAVTSNTVQFGAKIDFRFSLSEFKVIGYLYFDVLFQFSPFHFIAGIGAGLEVKMGNTTLFSISLDFELSGPTPWHAKGTASFSILFFTIKVHFDEEWGDKNSVEFPKIAVLPKAMEALQLDSNWTVELPVNRTALVTVRNIPSEPGKIVLQPFGSFKVSQTVLPIAQILEKFGENQPADIKKIDITQVKIGSKIVAKEYPVESFAPAMFKELQEKQKLSAPSYENMKSGVKVTETDEINVISRANRKVEYEVHVSDFDPTPEEELTLFTFDKNLFRLMTKGGAIGNSSLSKEYANKKLRQKDLAVNLNDEAFVVMNKSSMATMVHNEFSTGSYSEASDALKNLVAADPALKGKIKVVPAYHMEMA